jgi:hypothetical protein
MSSREQFANHDALIAPIHSLIAPIVTDDLRSYGAAASDLGIAKRHERGRWRNNRAESVMQNILCAILFSPEVGSFSVLYFRSSRHFVDFHSGASSPPKTVTKIRSSGLSPYAVPLRCSCRRCSLRAKLPPSPPPEGSPLRLASHAASAFGNHCVRRSR